MENILFTPKTFDELIGNKRTLHEWKEQMKGVNNDEILFIYGFSGVGKTIGAKLLINEFDYNTLFLETNTCMDGKDVLDRIMKFHQWIDLGTSLKEEGICTKKKLIVLDEVESFIKIDRNVLNYILTYKKKYKEASIPIVLLGHVDTLKKLGDMKHYITNSVKLSRLQDIDMFLFLKKRLPKNKIKLTELMKIAEDANGNIYTAILTVQQRLNIKKNSIPLANYTGDEQKTFPEIFECNNPCIVDKLLMEDDWMNPLKIHENIIKVLDKGIYTSFLHDYIYYELWRSKFGSEGAYDTIIPIMYLTNIIMWHIHVQGKIAPIESMDFSKLLSYISTQKKYRKLMYEKVPNTYPIEDLGLYWIQTYKEVKKRGKEKDVENIL